MKIKLYLLVTYLNSGLSAPIPAPKPLPPSVAQGLIAALTLAHAGIIGYAIHHEGQDQAYQYVGEQFISYLATVIA